MSQQDTMAEQDVLLGLWTDVRQQRERLSKIAEPTPKKALTELSDTGLSLVEDLVGYFVQFRQYVAESLQDIDERISALESDEAVVAALEPEEASMLLALAGTCEAFVRLIRDSSTSINDEAQKKLDEALALVEQTRVWVSERIDAEPGDDADEQADETASV